MFKTHSNKKLLKFEKKFQIAEVAVIGKIDLTA